MSKLFSGYDYPYVFEFLYMGIQKEFQSQGLGSALLFRCLEEYYEAQKQLDIPAAVLTALNTRAARFYAEYFEFSPVLPGVEHYIPMILSRESVVQLIESADGL
jgi:GNAT superfamily N-acetyltransferase